MENLGGGDKTVGLEGERAAGPPGTGTLNSGGLCIPWMKPLGGDGDCALRCGKETKKVIKGVYPKAV